MSLPLRVLPNPPATTTVQRLTELIAETCGIEPTEVALGKQIKSYVLDSLRMVELGVAIEEAFAIQLDIEGLATVRTVADLVDHVDSLR